MNRIFILKTIFLISFFSASSLHAAGNLSQSGYIRYLFENEKYFQAIAETDRYAADNHINPYRFNYFIALNYFKGGQYRTVINEFSLSGSSGFNETNLLFLYALYNIDETEALADRISEIDISAVNSVYSDDLCYLNTLIYLDEFDFKKAYTVLSEYNSSNPGSFNSRYMSLLAGYKDLKYKSPLFSTALSAFFPGAGQVYSGQYSDGIISLISIFGSALLTYGLYINDYKAESVLTGSFTALLYTGNIYGGYNSAKYRNYTISDSFRKKILKELDYNYDPEEYLNYDKLFTR
ncbi:MAG: hypothetical protein JW982_16360 [Spirochaetes bacterium]|nr:hypothetical protein [Spirochaetota bacterium]